jgi:hypothetical protein
MKHYSPTGRRNHSRPLKRLWISVTRMGQQVAQLHYIHGDDNDDDDRNKYAVEFKKCMGKNVKTYLRGYHASGLVNKTPIVTAAATLLALAVLEHRYNTFLRNITIYH